MLIFKRHFPEIDIELSASFTELKNPKVVSAFERLLTDDVSTLIKNL